MEETALRKTITKEEFCERTHTSKNCWIFETPDAERLHFSYEVVDNETIYYLDDGKGGIRRFKDMPAYGEIWSSTLVQNKWSLWNTWSVY